MKKEVREWSNQFPVSPPLPKPKVGKLWYRDVCIMQDKPFSLLHYEKKRLVATGSYTASLFKITY